MSSSPPVNLPDITLDDIGTAVSVVEAKLTPDSKDMLEREELEAVRLKNKLARSYIKNVKADRKMRKTYAGRILRYLEVYSFVVGALVVLAGFKGGGFALEPEILAALVGAPR